MPSAAGGEPTDGPLCKAVTRLDHDHVEGVIWNTTSRDTLQIVGIYDPGHAMFENYRDKYNLYPDEFIADLDRMLDETRSKPRLLKLLHQSWHRADVDCTRSSDAGYVLSN